MKKLVIGGLAALALTACSPQSSESAAIPVVTGPDASIVVLVDCGDDGVAGVHVKYGTGPDSDVLIGRNPTTRSVGGLDTFSSNYGTEPGFDDATLTDYNSGDVIAERETAGKVTLGAIVSAKESK